MITWLRHTLPLPLSPNYRHTLSPDYIWSHCSMPVRCSKIGWLLTRQNSPARCVQNGGTFFRDNRHRTAKRNQRTCQIDAVTWVNTGSWDFFKIDFVATMSTNWRNVRYQPTQSDIPSRTLGIPYEKKPSEYHVFSICGTHDGIMTFSDWRVDLVELTVLWCLYREIMTIFVSCDVY